LLRMDKVNPPKEIYRIIFPKIALLLMNETRKFSIFLKIF
jgi:hypothetical protein